MRETANRKGRELSKEELEAVASGLSFEDEVFLLQMTRSGSVLKESRKGAQIPDFLLENRQNGLNRSTNLMKKYMLAVMEVMRAVSSI